MYIGYLPEENGKKGTALAMTRVCKTSQQIRSDDIGV